MIYGYARVSSTGQKDYGTSLGDQEEMLRAKGASVVFSDAYTGTTLNRPELDKLLSVLKEGDTLVVSKMDRLGRSASDIQILVKSLIEKGVEVNIINMGVVSNTPMGKLMMNMMSAFAEFERDQIVERTQRGKAIKRKDPNWKEGRPAIEVDPVEYEMWKEKVRKGMSITDACKGLGISRAKWYRMA